MSGQNPEAILYDVNGNLLAVQSGVATPASTPLLMFGGSDGTNSRYILVDSSGRIVSVGAGVAGTPSGGVFSIQGVSGGTVLPISIATPDTTATGSLGALNATVPIALSGTTGVAMQLVAGTLVGTIVSEVSVDGGTTWVSTFFDDPSTGNKTSSIVFASNNTATTRVLVSADGASNMRVRVSAYTSGTATCNIRGSSQDDPPILFSGTAGGVLPPTIAQVGGTDGSNLRAMMTDVSGHQIIVGPGTAGTPSGGVVTIQGVSGGTVIPVSGTVAVTQSTSPWVDNISQFGGTNISTGTGAGGAGIPRVTVSNDSNILATQSGTWTVQPGNTTNTTPWLVTDSSDGPVTPGTVAGKSSLMGGQFNTSLPTLTNTQQSAIQLDSSGRVLIGAIPTGANTIGIINQGTAASLANAWSTKITDTTNGPVAVKAASTAAAAADPSLVIAFSPNSPLPTGTNTIGTISTQTNPIVIESNATITFSQILGPFNNLPVGYFCLYIRVANAPTGTNPKMQWQVFPLDPSGVAVVGSEAFFTQFIVASGEYILTGFIYTSSVQINVSLQGTTPSFSGVSVTLVPGIPLAPQQLIPVHVGATLAPGSGVNAFFTKISNVPIGLVTVYINVQSAPTGTLPILNYFGQPCDPSSGTTIGSQTAGPSISASGFYSFTFLNTTGVIQVSWSFSGTNPSFTNVFTTVVPASGYVITDGINGPVTVKAASTAVAAADSSLAVGLSPNSPLPAGSNVIGALTANQTVSQATPSALQVTANQTTPANLQAEVGGLGAAGSAVVGNPVLVGGVDGAGVDTRTLTVSIDRAVLTMGSATGIPIIGQSSGVGRILRVDRLGHVSPGYKTLLAADPIEGSTINSWLWTQSTSTMTIAQSSGILTLNNNATTTTATYAIITTNRQFGWMSQSPIGCSFKALITQTTNAFNELGFGAPTTNTAIINNGAFFRVDTSGEVFAVTSFNGTETVSANLGTLVTSTYYIFFVWIEDGDARFIVESSSGTPLIDYFAQIPVGTPDVISAVSHLPSFARVYTSGAAGAAPQTKIANFEVCQYDINTSKLWPHQLSAAGKSANINPTTFAQTTQLAAGAAPTTTTPTNAAVAYTTLGGEYSLNATASSENLLGVFGFQVPSPYNFYITDIMLPQPFITTGLGAVINIQEWCFMVASSNNPSTATGQRYTLGMFSAAASAGAGTVFNGQPLRFEFVTPIVVLPGQFLLVLVKMISGSAVGVYRGSILINGYYE